MTQPADDGTWGVARVRHLLRLEEGADADAFERKMLGEVFLRSDTQDADHAGDPALADHHLLLGESDFGSDYVWEVTMAYVMHHTATPTWLGNRVAKSFKDVSVEIGAFAQLVDTEVHVDVRRWRRRRGLDSDASVGR